MKGNLFFFGISPINFIDERRKTHTLWRLFLRTQRNELLFFFSFFSTYLSLLLFSSLKKKLFLWGKIIRLQLLSSYFIFFFLLNDIDIEYNGIYLYNIVCLRYSLSIMEFISSLCYKSFNWTYFLNRKRF